MSCAHELCTSCERQASLEAAADFVSDFKAALEEAVSLQVDALAELQTKTRELLNKLSVQGLPSLNDVFADWIDLSLPRLDSLFTYLPVLLVKTLVYVALHNPFAASVRDAIIEAVEIIGRMLTLIVKVQNIDGIEPCNRVPFPSRSRDPWGIPLHPQPRARDSLRDPEVPGSRSRPVAQGLSSCSSSPSSSNSSRP